MISSRSGAVIHPVNCKPSRVGSLPPLCQTVAHLVHVYYTCLMLKEYSHLSILCWEVQAIQPKHLPKYMIFPEVLSLAYRALLSCSLCADRCRGSRPQRRSSRPCSRSHSANSQAVRNVHCRTLAPGNCTAITYRAGGAPAITSWGGEHGVLILYNKSRTLLQLLVTLYQV